MRTREKISILKKMRVELQKNLEEGSFGLCIALVGIDTKAEISRKISWIGEELFISHELGIKKPKYPYNKTYWYDPTDINPRIRAINRLLKKLES